MFIAAHIPPLKIGYSGHSPVSATNLISKLLIYPNLVLWIAGNVHRNKVTLFKSPNETKSELGFLHVETSSLRDFLQEILTFEIVCNSDNTISIFATNVDPTMKEDSLAAVSRSYAIAENQIFKFALDKWGVNNSINCRNINLRSEVK